MILSGTVMSFAETYSPRLGGGPSESAVWEYYDSDNVTLTRTELEELSDELYYAKKSSSGSRTRYEAVKIIAGLFAIRTFPPITLFLAFSSDYFDIVDESSYEVDRALGRYPNARTFTLDVDIYQREATREQLVSITYVKGR